MTARATSRSMASAAQPMHQALRALYERNGNDFVFFRRLEKTAIWPWLNLQPGDRVCELGCYNGADARQMARRFGCVVYGVDIDPAAVRIAQRFNKTRETHFVVAASEVLPFASSSFDKICAISVLEHFACAEHALQEVYRCLKPGGVLALTADSFELGEILQGSRKIHTDKFSVRKYYCRSDLLREIGAAGFELLHAEPILRHWLSGLLFELNIRLRGVKHAASPLLPLIRWLERAYGHPQAGYMQMIAAIKPPKA